VSHGHVFSCELPPISLQISRPLAAICSAPGVRFIDVRASMPMVVNGDEDGMGQELGRVTTVDWGEAVRAHTPRVVASLLALSLPLDRAEDIASQAWERLMAQDRDGKLREVKLPGLAIAQARFYALTWLKSSRREAGLDDDLPAAGDPER